MSGQGATVRAVAAEPSSGTFFIQRPKGVSLSPNLLMGAAVPAVELVAGDISTETTDALVVPTGGLVDLAVRRLAGPGLAQAFRESVYELYGGVLPPGQAFVTPGFRLRAAHVIYCAPPAYAGQPSAADAQLASCHGEALRLARNMGLASISFPAIGTGFRGYPVYKAASAAVAAVIGALGTYGSPPVTRFVLFGPAMLEVYLAATRAELEHLQRYPGAT
jgi:O-acetyl-ADP-ribose deacetylase